MKLADRLYAVSPTWLQHVAVSAFGFQWKRRRFGTTYAAERDAFLARERYDTQSWRHWQTSRLRELLHEAVTRVPYYRREWKELLSPAQAQRFTLGDLRRLPVLEKNVVRQSPEEFLLDGKAPEDAVICPTSGSTGTPVRAYWTNPDFQRSLALREARGCVPAGVSYEMPRATIHGRLVVPVDRSAGPFHRFNIFERQVYFSAFHISEKNVAQYAAALVRHGITWGTGYTHCWELIGRLMLEQGIPPPPTMKAVITTSEPMLPDTRAVLSRAFGCRVYQEYGQVEEGVWACEGADGRMRQSPDASVLELLRPNGAPAEPGEPGDVVCTSFIRRCQPFIRYRLGDVATLDPEPDRTGRAMPILKRIDGRLEEMVVAPDGRRVGQFYGIFVELKGCREAQVIQEAPERVRVRMVPSPEFSDATVQEVRQRMRLRCGDRMQVIVDPVEAIPRTKAGKFRAVVNLVSNPQALSA
jgi:phenylacetate-CoA ligase